MLSNKAPGQFVIIGASLSRYLLKLCASHRDCLATIEVFNDVWLFPFDLSAVN